MVRTNVLFHLVAPIIIVVSKIKDPARCCKTLHSGSFDGQAKTELMVSTASVRLTFSEFLFVVIHADLQVQMPSNQPSEILLIGGTKRNTAQLQYSLARN